MPDQMLIGKSVIVTGSGGGIGAAYARLAAAHGASVIVNDVDSVAAQAVADEITRSGGTAVAHVADVSDWESSRGLVSAAFTQFGRLDGLVNNAGVFAAGEPDAATREDIERIVRVNILGAVHCGTHALEAMKEQRSGAILNVTSGAQCGTRGLALYGMTKGAIASLTYGWAIDLADFGVRVNAISPNAHTRMADEYERYRGVDADGQNVGKSPESNAPVAVFLLSDEASSITGQVVRVDGSDLTLMTHPRQLVPAAAHAAWTPDLVASAFAEELVGYGQPLGLADQAVADG